MGEMLMLQGTIVSLILFIFKNKKGVQKCTLTQA